MNIPTINLTDGYKLDHRRQYPDNTGIVYSNWTPRKSRIDGVEHVVFFGMNYFIKEYLIKDFKVNFFDKPIDEVAKKYTRRINNYLGPNKIGIKHIRELHELGYMPVRIKALPEGSRVNIRVPMFTVVNTDKRFSWLTNYLETIISNIVWMPCTSATIAYEYRKLFDRWAIKTSDLEGFTQFQGHDFSFRGMAGLEAALMSGAAHLLSFVGTDTIPAIDFLEDYYGADSDKELVGCSVPATEHSVMCMGTLEDELGTFRRLITEVYPEGIVSIVSDTWDLWKVCTEYLPALKDVILSRKGKVVIRPDSSPLTPVQILCGLKPSEITLIEDSHGRTPKEPEIKGVIELLWDAFGGTYSKTGYRMLNEHIGAIYGDSITLQRAEEINSRLEAKGFASTNWVAGIGSYTYQYNTRDTFGFAMKSTYGEVDGVPRLIFKDPITDGGMKRSAKGLLRVDGENGNYTLKNECTWEEEGQGELKTVFEDGKLLIDPTLAEIRNRLIGV